MILPNITVKRGFSQAMKCWCPVQITFKIPYVYEWLWWNFEIIEPEDLNPPVATETHSYCEAWSAGSLSPWHIRRLTSKGKKLSGGADTQSLCGQGMSWDVRPMVTKHPLTEVCAKCQEAWEKEMPRGLGEGNAKRPGRRKSMSIML
jgi:hypothetical protein